MFFSLAITEQYKSYKSLFIKALEALNQRDFYACDEALQAIKNEVSIRNSKSLITNEVILNDLFVLRTYIDFLILYKETWKVILDKKFSNSWSSLQSTIDLLRIIKKFSGSNEDSKHLLFFEEQLLNLEKLYPYNIFFSMGAIVDYYECSICGLDIDSFECNHFKGELYAGEMALGIAKNIETIDHIALVKNPVDKRCVVQYDDEGEAFSAIRFIAESLKQNKFRILDFYEVILTKEIIANPNYVKLGRNEKCYCGSGKKFKYCCDKKKTIEGNHVEVVLNRMPIKSILTK